jgi:23S rRNA pseudouridine1911/1915/1917 synthase
MTEPLAVLFEDAHVLAVNKPAGVLTQGATGGAPPSLEVMVRHHLDAARPESVYLGTVHRLDRPVSGIVVWAKTPKAARRLASQFAARDVRKEYWAIVAEGAQATEEEGVWDDWLSSPDSSGVVRVAAAGTVGAREARTRFRRDRAIRLPEGAAWLRLWPLTGRTHQLRAQAAHRGLPILGDAVYGSTRTFPVGIALHARELEFLHPTLRRPVTLSAALPPAWEAAGIVLPERPSSGQRT